MEVTFLGTGSAMPTGDRMQTGLLVTHDDRRLLVDCGSGVLHRLAATNAGYEGVSTVLLTHLHLDHVADLLPLLKARWLAGEEHLEVVGPVGTKGLVDGLLSVHGYLDGRVDLQVREIVASETVSVGGLSVESRETQHSIDGLAYRFAVDGDDAEFAFSGDTEAFAGMARFVEGCRVVAHDCSFPDSVDVDGHPTPSQLGEAFADSDVDHLYLTHLYPHTEGTHEEMCATVAESFDGEVHIARDGLRVSVS
ncbi:MBL fold metallo-hydrolase [Halonotius aquaticus]|uniref:MBL fold metallo-hydrolase n=1 Tax=Halonotius aquaticus TaxID=2216978 RepID=A0A3A6PZF0_9EURY|nr:MBL fold metallo-hydrolase [Halonotius aquaticus]RJX45145.1 MBL fold metallo-hydrolase [Halonotius aquaticus]